MVDTRHYSNHSGELKLHSECPITCYIFILPSRYERSAVMEGSVYSGADRHNGEIIAFYLSLLLGLRRTPVAVGRRINLSTEIFSKADPDLAATFYKNSTDFNTKKITESPLLIYKVFAFDP